MKTNKRSWLWVFFHYYYSYIFALLDIPLVRDLPNDANLYYELPLKKAYVASCE